MHGHGLVTVILVIIVIRVAFLLIRLILTLPTEPSASERAEIQRKKQELRRKAGLYPFKW